MPDSRGSLGTFDATNEITTLGTAIVSGGVALGGDQPKYDNLKIGKDTSISTDGDMDDALDYVIINDAFGSTDVSYAYDHAGNLVSDGRFEYVYDAWNRLAKVQSIADISPFPPVYQTAEFDGTGRRMKKVVTNSGKYDKTDVYLHDGQKIIETRDGSGNMVSQFIHGTDYIDELVMMRAKDNGDLYVHQAERDRGGSVKNWNVIGLTDLGGSLVERYDYTPYGTIKVHQLTSYGDRDGDGDVDSTDKGTPGTTCTGTVTGACRILDFDFDADYDSTDATKFDALAQGIARHPGRHATGVDQPFGHQGLMYELEIGSYQNRARQYDPDKMSFVQRDPFGLFPGSTRASYLADQEILRHAHLTGLYLKRVMLQYVRGMNTYQYHSSNPFNIFDPSGLVPCIATCYWPFCSSAAACHNQPVGGPCGNGLTCNSVGTCCLPSGACCGCS